MALNVYFALTVFPRRDTQKNAWEVWLTVQPYVLPADLPAWLDALQADGSLPGVAYCMLVDQIEHPGVSSRANPMSDDDVSKMVPVPLPGDMSLTIGLRGTAGNSIGQATNDRSGVVIIDTPDAIRQFERDNVVTSERATVDAAKDKRVTQSGPYAQVMARQLFSLRRNTRAKDDDPTASRVADMLTLSFLGGTVRRFRLETVSRQSDVHLFTVHPLADLTRVLPRPSLRGATTAPTTFSHVSAVGLMFQLDRIVSPAALSTLTGIDIWVHPHGATPNPGAVIHSATEDEYLGKFFAAYDPGKLELADQRVKIVKDLPLSNRAYVTQHLMPFAPVILSDAGHTKTATFRKPASPPPAALAAKMMAVPALGGLDRLLIRPKARADSETHASLLKPSAFSATLGETLDVRLIPYRAQTDGGGAMLFQLVPAERFRSRFVALFGALASGPNPTTWIPDCTLYRENGEELVTPDQPKGAANGFVGAYAFAWDDPVNADSATLQPTSESLPTVLFWLEPPLDETVKPAVPMTTVPLTLSHTVAPTLTASYLGDDDALGPRWEWTPPPAPQQGGRVAIFADVLAEFNSIALTASNLTADEIKEAVVVAIGLRGDDVFAPAQSATSIEGIIAVSYPAKDPQAPVDMTSVDPVEEYALALANYNKLDVAYKAVASLPGPGQPFDRKGITLLNFWSEALAVFRVDLPPHDGVGFTHECTFHYRYREALYAPDTRADIDVVAEPGVAQPFFAKQYGRLGQTRQIFYDLEHTTGAAFEPGADQVRDGGRFIHDLPPTIASNLRRLGNGGTAANELPFLTWAFDTTAQIVTIYVNAHWLAPVDGTATPGTPTSAWRAVAEIASGTAQLRGRFRRFDFPTAARAAGKNPGSRLQLSDGLLAVGSYEQGAWPLPNDVIDRFRSWLAGAAQPASLDFQVTVGGVSNDPDRPPLATSCHVVELHLEVIRPADAIPDRNASWDLLRPRGDLPVSQLFDANGQRTTPAQGTQLAFAHYLDTLASGWSTINPRRPSETSKLTTLLAGPEDTRDGDALGTGTAGGEWIAPRIGANTTPGAPITTALLPLGFRPLPAHVGGVVSATGLLRHLAALEILLDTAPGDWRDVYKSIADWQKWFANLDHQQPAILALLLKAQSTVVPAFEQNTPGIDPEVDALVKEAETDGGACTGLRARIKRAILGEPAQFATARAMLLTRLSASTPLPGDFVRLDMTRQIQPGTGSVTSRPVDTPSLPLAAALLEGVSEQRIGFLEILSNAKYDDSFFLTKVAAFSLQNIAASDNVSAPRFHLSLADTHLPSGKTDDPGQPTAANDVHLPSRQPLVAPINVWTASPEAFEHPDWWQDWDFSGKPLSRRQLLKNAGLFSSADKADSLVMHARRDVKAVKPTTELDRGRIVAVFLVTSDESNEFENDSFPLAIVPGDPNAKRAPSRQPADPGAPARAFFTELDTATALTKLTDLKMAVDLDVLNFATSAYGSAPPEIDPSLCSIRVVTDPHDPSAHPRLVVDPPIPGLDAFLFAPADMKAAPTAYVLILTYECDVWHSQRIGIGQTRNVVPTPGQPPFRKELWQAAPTTGIEKSVTPKPRQNSPVQSSPVDRRPTPLSEFITHGLVQAGLLQPEQDPATRWAKHDLSVTVKGKLISTMDEFFPDSAGKMQTRTEIQNVDHGLIPLQQFKAPAGSLSVPPTAPAADTVNWDPGYATYIADFVWTDAHNNEILRIANVTVVFTPEP